MWEMVQTTTWEKDQKHYAKKHPNELAGVLRNLARYLAQLNCCSNPAAIQAGYLHNEPMGIRAIDQRGSKGALQETRLYTFADTASKMLYIITIGNKSDQPTDIELAKEFVQSILPAKE
jgi:hypothetical protein